MPKQFFYLQPKKRVQQSSKRHFWNVLYVVLVCFSFAQETEAIFISIWYHKTSRTQVVKSQGTKGSLRSLAQPNRDSAFEQKTRIFPSREIWGNSQNSFFTYNRSNKPTRAQKDIFGTYSTSFWKVSILLEKQNFFISIPYHKTSQTQDGTSQSTNLSLRKLAQPNRDSSFEQKTRIVPSREIWGSSQNNIFSYNRSNKPTTAQKDTFGTYSTSFWKVSNLLKKQIFFIIIRYHKIFQTQERTSQSTNRSLRKLARAKPNTAVEQT